MKVTEINIFPIKGAKGNSLSEGIAEIRGLRGDRRMMLVDDNGRFLSQREFSDLARVAVDESVEGFSISFDGNETFVDKNKFENTIEVTVWNDLTLGLVADAEVNNWFSEHLDSSCRLVVMSEEANREINPRFNRGNEVVSFADAYPILLVGESSLYELNSRLSSPIPMNRFRPNLVIEGSEPFAEDRWHRLQIGDVVLRATKPCVRCVVTTIDQLKGEKEGTEPLTMLAKFRSVKDVMPDRADEFGLRQNDVLFGMNFVVEAFGRVRVGDEVEVITE